MSIRLRTVTSRRIALRLAVLLAAATLLCGQAATAISPPPQVSEAKLPAITATISARDTLKPPSDTNPDALECLKGLCWQPTDFVMRFEEPSSDRGSLVIRFPSPVHQTDQSNAEVALEWYVARDADGQPVLAPAMIVVHESGRGMAVGRLLARGFCAQGLHAFLIHLPGYGRRPVHADDDPKKLLAMMKQGIADTRRASDVVRNLALVDSTRIGLQGTSLGGFIASSAAALDDGFDSTFILLSGGNLHDVILKGNRDAAKVRERLYAAGMDDSDIRELTHPVEPLRIAHRIDSSNTWLYTGLYDDVVPPECSTAFAAAAGLPTTHHVLFPADHYSGVIFLPSVIVDVASHLRNQ